MRDALERRLRRRFLHRNRLGRAGTIDQGQRPSPATRRLQRAILRADPLDVRGRERTAGFIAPEENRL